MDASRERLIDITVIAAALLVGAFLASTSMSKSGERRDEIAREVRLIEQSGILHDASMTLPSETRTAIGLETRLGDPETTVLDEIEEDVIAQNSNVETRLVWIAVAVSWREDTRARSRIAALASDKANLDAHRATLDELLRLANGKGADEIGQLVATFDGFGASRWLTGHLRERHLANVGDPAAPELAADVSNLAATTVTRWTIVSGLELFLFPAIGLVVLVLMPMFMRQRLFARGLVADLAPSPFRLDRTWRVLCGWFIAFQSAGFVILVAISAFVTGSPLVAISMALQALVGLALALWLVDLWARAPRDERSVSMALGLAARSRLKMVAVWLVPGLALAMALVRAADYLNLVIMRRPPELQSVVQLIIDEGSPLLVVLVGLGAVLLAPLTEEVVFRGFLFRNLRDSVGKGLAMLISGLAFAAVHFQPTLILPLTALGIALALLYDWTGSLYVPIAVHAAWNLFALIKIELWRI